MFGRGDGEGRGERGRMGGMEKSVFLPPDLCLNRGELGGGATLRK